MKQKDEKDTGPDEAPIMGKLVTEQDLAEPQKNGTDGAKPEKKKRKMFQSRRAVLSILFLVTGAIGIPLLWTCPHFSRGERLFWAVIVSLYTAALLYGTGAIIWWVYRQTFGV